MQGMTTDNTPRKKEEKKSWTMECERRCQQRITLPFGKSELCCQQRITLPFGKSERRRQQRITLPFGKSERYCQQRITLPFGKSERRCQQRIALPWGKMWTVEKERHRGTFSPEKQQRESDGHHQRHG